MAQRRKNRRIIQGRQTAAYEGDLVVFLIGMRVNRWWGWRRWLPVTRAMTPMLNELVADPDSGLLGFQTAVSRSGPMLIQYWRDAASLQAFAGDPTRSHRPAWLEFFRSAYASGDVGVWHETYAVPAGSHESVYVNMPPLGLGKLSGLSPVGSRGDAFAERMAGAARG